MNVLNCVSLLTMIVLCAPGCSSITRVDTSTLKSVRIATLATQPKEWEEIDALLQAGKSVVFVVGKGESMPLETRVVMPMATVQSQGTALVFTCETYFLVDSGSMRISPDGQRWADIEDLRAQRELFGWSSGSASFGFSASNDAGAKFILDIRTKK